MRSFIDRLYLPRIFTNCSRCTRRGIGISCAKRGNKYDPRLVIFWNSSSTVLSSSAITNRVTMQTLDNKVNDILHCDIILTATMNFQPYLICWECWPDSEGDLPDSPSILIHILQKLVVPPLSRFRLDMWVTVLNRYYGMIKCFVWGCWSIQPGHVWFFFFFYLLIHREWILWILEGIDGDNKCQIWWRILFGLDNKG